MQKWEYVMIRVNSDAHDLGETTKKINELGTNGWELVGASQYDFQQTLIFKRPKSETPSTLPPIRK